MHAYHLGGAAIHCLIGVAAAEGNIGITILSHASFTRVYRSEKWRA
jgi:hypothetical protein